MVKDLRLDCIIKPDVMDMDINNFRQFVLDECIPVYWEAMAEAKSSYAMLQPVVSSDMRSGNVDIECKTDFKGNTTCSVKATIRF